MKDELISFDTAKLAKEKGCELESNHIYNQEGELDTVYSSFWFAPTQSLLQRWLREKHKIFISMTYDPHPTDCYEFTIGGWDQNKGENVCIEQDNTFHLSYEQALESGLQEALKLIKT